MTKVILIFPFDLLSHYLRCLVLADRYDQNEYKILFQSSAKYNLYVEQHGYETFKAKHFDSDLVTQCAVKFNFDWITEPNLAEVLLDQISAIELYKPDIVIGDVAPTLKMAAEFTDVTYISLLNGYLTKYYSKVRLLPKAHPVYPYLRLLPLGVRNKLVQIGEKFTFKQIHKPFQTIRAALKLKVLQDYLSETEGDINYICDLPSLFPQLYLPENYKYIGPLVYQTLANEVWIDELSDDKPIICVSMGSSGDWNKLTFLNNPYYARYTIVIAGYVGNLFTASHLVVKNFVNLRQLLHKASLMICHGGNGTLYLGMLANVYMLCIANHFEQEWNVQALEKNKRGEFATALNEYEWRDQISNGIKKTEALIPMQPLVF